MSTDDQVLIRKAKGGDRQACRLLVEKYQRRAFAVAFPILKNEDDAMDVVQDAFVKVFAHLDGFQGNSSFFTWLYRIIKNLCIDRLRSKQRWKQVEYDDAVGRETDIKGVEEGCLPRCSRSHPGKELARKELAAKTYEAFDQLTTEHQTILVLREVEGLSYAEIARIIGCPKGTVMSRLHHARQNMKVALASYLGEDLTLE